MEFKPVKLFWLAVPTVNLSPELVLFGKNDAGDGLDDANGKFERERGIETWKLIAEH